MSKKFLALSLALAAAGTAMAAGTEAGTKIRNQAIADFTDSNGTRQTTKSNEVFTVVQPVYFYSITPDEATTGQTPARSTDVPNTAAPRYFSYYVTNTGNATDTISLALNQLGSSTITGTATVKLYIDSTPNGQVDSGEIEVPKVGGVYQISVGADQTVNLVAEIRLPVQSTLSPVPFGNFNLVGDSQNISGTGDETGNPNNTVQVRVSNDAAFQVTKDSSLADYVERNGELKYTIQGSNNGAIAAEAVSVSVDGSTRYGILVEDVLPNDGTNQLAFLTSALGTSAVSSPNNYVYSGRGVAVPIYKVSGVWTATFSTSATAVALLIQADAAGTTDPNAFFQPGDQFTMVFTVRVDNDANSGNTPSATILSVNKPINNTANVQFQKNPADTGTTTPSNTRTNRVAADYAVAVGQDDSAPGTQATDNSGTEETYATTSPAAYLGQPYSWTVYLTNNGNTDDNIRLTVDSADDLQNVTLSYTNGTSITVGDPILVPQGQTIAVRVTGTIPLTATVGSPAGVRLLADSANVATAIGGADKSLTTALDAADSVILASPNISNPYSVDGAVDDAAASKTGDGNTGNDNTDVATAPATYVNVNPGTNGTYPIEIRNTGVVPDSYTIDVPVGATVHTFTDTNGDGNWDPGEPIGSAITTTPILNPNQAVNLVVVYPIASSQAPGQVDVPVTLTSTTRPTTTDTFTVSFVVQANNQVTFTPDRTDTVVPGGVVTYTHTVANNGNTHVSFDLANVLTGTPGDANDGTSDKGLIYTYTLDNGATYIINPGAICLAPGSNATIKVRVEAPSSIAIGTEDPEILSGVASFFTDAACSVPAVGSANQTLSVTDTTTVVGTLIKIDKKVKNLGTNLTSAADDRDALYKEDNIAYPGDYLEYKLEAFNNGNLDLFALVVSDKLPTNTEFVNFEVDDAALPVGTKIMVSANYDPTNVGASTWVDITTVDADADGVVTATEWAAAFAGFTFDTLYVGFSTDGDTTMDFANTDDRIQPAQGSTVLFRVKVK